MKLVYRIGVAAALLVLSGLSATAAEIAHLRNGFAIRHERHEPRDAVTRLYLTDAPDNYVDVPTAEILAFEEIDPPLAPAVVPAPLSTLDAAVSAASSRNNIDPDLILSMIRAESGFNPNAISPKGAQGLMQLMPQTAAQLGVLNVLDPAANVEGGTRYLRELLERYQNDVLKALAAYNAGPERVEQYRGVPPYRETRVYIARVIQDFNRKKSAQLHSQSDPSASHELHQNPKATTPSPTARPNMASPTRSASAARAGS
jgi:soluble lytic murein transglycosylase-like protein